MCDFLCDIALEIKGDFNLSIFQYSIIPTFQSRDLVKLAMLYLSSEAEATA
jgi:hypothetical protein